MRFSRRHSKPNDKFKEPDLVLVPATYLYSDNDGSYFLDEESYETVSALRETAAWGTRWIF